jgi:hypothetical protein
VEASAAHAAYQKDAAFMMSRVHDSLSSTCPWYFWSFPWPEGVKLNSVHPARDSVCWAQRGQLSARWVGAEEGSHATLSRACPSAEYEEADVLGDHKWGVPLILAVLLTGALLGAVPVLGSDFNVTQITHNRWGDSAP